MGDGKKFKTVEDLARGKWEADEFINTLKEELAQVRSEVTKGKTVEELLASIKEMGNNRTPMSNEDNHDHENDEVNSKLSLEEIKRAVKQELQMEQVYAKEAENLSTAQNKLREVYGDNANAELVKKANELGVTMDYLKQMASTSPNAFLTLVGANQPKQPDRRNDFFAPPANQLHTQTENKPNFGGYKPKSYYDNLKKTDIKAWKDPNIVVEMHEAALKLGPAFFEN